MIARINHVLCLRLFLAPSAFASAFSLSAWPWLAGKPQFSACLHRSFRCAHRSSSVENQLQPCRRPLGGAAGPMSGTRTDRPQLAAALEFARQGDVLVVARLDRLARSMRQLLTTVDTLQARGIGLRSLHENIDTTSATGRLILHIFAALGQFEVELLRERTRTALAASRARGRIGGRPPALDAIKVKAAKAMLASGTMTASEIAQQIGCSASTLYRHVPGGRTAITEVKAPTAA